MRVSVAEATFKLVYTFHITRGKVQQQLCILHALYVHSIAVLTKDLLDKL